MKITIDTKEDSKDEIKKVISLLQNMLSESGTVHTNIFEDKTEQSSEGMFNIFNKTEPNTESIKSVNTEDLLNETGNIEEPSENNDEKKNNENNPGIETY